MHIPRLPARTALATLLAALLTTASATAIHAAPNNRLERDVLPTLQTVNLKLDPSRPDYSGATHIDLKIVNPVASFALYAAAMDVIQVRLSRASGSISVSHEVTPAGQLIVKSGEMLPAGDYSLDIDFRNDFDTRANGLYRLKSGEDWYCFTQFEAVAAREAFPCWDEPAFKIPFQLTLTVPEKSRAISNTPVEKQNTVGGQTTVTFKRTPPIPSYLAAIAVGPFDLVPIRGMSVPGNVVTVKGSAALAAEAARVSPRILAALEKYFGRPYPYEKLDLLAVPEFAAGAMENVGAITYRDAILLMEPASASVRQRQRLASITAHEMAHMWFGDLVTMEWWDDLWLNESFASWMGDKITDQVFPQYNTSVRELTGTQEAMETDARLSTRAIRQSVDAFANIDRLFDELSYQKGQAVLSMLEGWLGPEVFRRGVNAYLKEHEWKNATAADLWRALSTAAGRDISPATNSFLDQGGLPLVTLEVQTGGAVRLQQRRFLNSGTQAPRPASWKIPVTLRYSDGRQVHTQNVLLGETEQIVKLERTTAPTWVHPNAGERGYYRWSVPTAMLDTLAIAAPKALDTRERVGFLNNLSALLDAGLVSGDDFLRTLTRFADDPAPEVVSSLIVRLTKVHDTFVSPDLRGSFALTTRKMLRPALKRFGMTPVKGEPEPVSLMRPNLLAMLGAHGWDKDVLDWAKRSTRAYLAQPDSVDPSLVGTALELAARDGDTALFDTYRMRFETTKVPSDRARFLAALGHFRSGDLVERALDYALVGPLKPHEILTIAYNVRENEELKERVWRWLRTGYRPIVTKIPPFYLPNLPEFAECCQTARLEEAKAYFGQAETNFPGTQDELAKATDRIRDCVTLRDREGPAVARYLVQYAQSRSSAAIPAANP
ncbi:MAG TPA: M1 family metallopeptidase [Candidatus Eisenbacteria bacterium]|nr:M1 family metallopeptidase [Candidatus Eisenbacteria bacterium]